MSVTKPSLTIRSVIVAEDVRQEIDGKTSVIGMFAGNIQVAAPEARLPKIVFRIEFMVEDEPANVKFNFAVIAPSGQPLFQAPDPLEFHTNPKQPGVAIIGWGPVIFRESGVYEIHFGFDSPPEKIGTFDVVLSSPLAPNPTAKSKAA